MVGDNDGILKGFSGDSQVEEDTPVSTKQGNPLDQKIALLTAEYKKWLDASHMFRGAWDSIEVGDTLAVNDIMIAHFCDVLPNYEQHEKFGYTGEFLTGLVRSAYESGHNNFVLSLQKIQKPLEGIAKEVVGYMRDPIRITINGDVGKHCGSRAYTAHIIVNGNADEYAASNARNCEFTFTKNVKTHIGKDAEYCSFVFKSRVSGMLKKVDACDVVVYDAPYGFGEQCTNTSFFSTNDAVLDGITRVTGERCNYKLLDNSEPFGMNGIDNIYEYLEQ